MKSVIRHTKLEFLLVTTQAEELNNQFANIVTTPKKKKTTPPHI